VELSRSALVGYSAGAMFDLIEAAENYPSFLPWCAAATVVERDDRVVVADISIDFHGVRFGFRTRNPKRRPEWMAVTLERGPFRHFEGEWYLTALAPDACKIEFALRYEFEGAFARTLAAPVFNRIANTLVDAFVARADAVLGNGAIPAADPRTANMTGAPSDER